MEVINRATVKARRPHVCDFCGSEIPKGESYEASTCKNEDRIYTWHSHVHCQNLCDEIWHYVDPDNGMTRDDFLGAVRELTQTFYCPFHCEHYDKEVQDCAEEFDDNLCVRRFAAFMETRRLDLVLEQGRGLCWRVRELGRHEGGAR